MEPNQTAQTVKSTPGEDIVFRDVDKKHKGMIIGMICLAILAAGGIGFGVWAYMDGNAQKEKLNEQISVLETQNSGLLNRTDGSDDATMDGEENSGVDSMNYIYVGEWGLKIKIPDGLSISGYDFNTVYNSNWGGVTDMLMVWGTKVEGGQYSPDFADSTKNGSGMGMVMRFAKGTELKPESAPTLLFSDDNYDYYYTRTPAPYSTDETDLKWEVESSDLIYKMISDKENYSSI